MTPAVPDPTVEALSDVLRAHQIECTGVGEVTCRGCRELRWMTWADYHAHVAVMLAPLLAARATAPDPLRDRLQALCDAAMRNKWHLGTEAVSLTVAQVLAVLEEGS